MENRLARILDECIVRISEGETIEQCLADYPDERSRLEPLLDTALSVSAIPRATPSDEFKAMARARLTRRLHQEYLKSGRQVSPTADVAGMWQRLWSTVAGSRRIAIPVTVLLVAVVASLLLPGRLSPLSTTPALATPGTLSILSGTVEIQGIGSDSWQQASDSLELAVGTRIKTAANSHGLLTLFEGSTVKLEPNTVVTIKQVTSIEDQPTGIVIEQWSGRTWSHVLELADVVSCFQIETPSASIAAQGTLFAVEVDETGSTGIITKEGSVTVAAQGEEVQLVANRQIQVRAGATPSPPQIVPVAPYELVITTDSPAIGSVCDPTGSSTGYLPSGLSFNQITGSGSLLSSNGTHTITLAQPVSGEYIVALRHINEEPIRFNVQARSQGRVVFQHTGQLGDTGGDDWLICLNLRVDDGQIVSATVSSQEPLRKNAPEKVVEVESVTKRIEPIRSRVRNNVTATDNTSDNQSGSTITNRYDQGKGEEDTGDIVPDYDVAPDTRSGDIPDTTTDNQSAVDSSTNQ